MTAVLTLFDLFLLVLGAFSFGFGILYLLLRMDAWLSGRRW